MATSYRILNTLGEGGFGTVYRAEQLGEGGFSRPVAVKMLHPEASRSAEKRKRLRDEARILGQVRHRAIVQTYGMELLDDRWSVVMELVDGVTLRRVVRSHGPLPWTVALEVIREVAAALYAAWHAQGAEGQALHLLHRDIKPSNIQITPQGEVKLLDFGLARAEAVPREASTAEMRFGSRPYMAPERLDSVDGPPGDVYSLGASLYELLVGKSMGRAYGNPDRHEEHLQSALEELVPVVWDNPDLVAFVGSMLAHDPSLRPSMREVERGCQDYLTLSTGESLLDWAEAHVVALMERDTPLEDALTGSILEPDSRVWSQGGLIPSRLTREVPPRALPARMLLTLAMSCFFAGGCTALLLVYLLS